jgi:thiamine-phosphate pyrophosphorylase
MARRKRQPRLFLMTDPRMGDALWGAIDRLPRGAGIIVRHHGWPQSSRLDLCRRIKARSRGRHVLLVAVPVPADVRPDGMHLPAAARKRPRARGLLTAAVHDRRELARARALGADAVLVSPVFGTESHPGGRPLGPMRFATLARAAHCPVIALGGMTQQRFRRLAPLGAAGWAAISAWMR